MNAKNDKVKVELDKIVNLFKSQDLPYKCAKVFLSNGNKPSSKWSLSNKLIMLTNETMDARGFNQWKQVERYVKKGSKAMYILAPKIIKIDVENKETKEKEKMPIVKGFLAIPVFRYEDTDGKAIPEYEPKQVPPLMDIAKKLNLKVDYSELAQVYGAYAFYDDNAKRISLSTFDVGTFFHELVHAIHYKLDNDAKKLDIAQKECIAELTSAVLCSVYGIEQEDKNNYSYNYIKYYANMTEKYGTDNDKVYRLILKVLAKVQEILDYIFTISPITA